MSKEVMFLIIRTVLSGGSNSRQVHCSEKGMDPGRQVSGVCYCRAGERLWESELGRWRQVWQGEDGY